MRDLQDLSQFRAPPEHTVYTYTKNNGDRTTGAFLITSPVDRQQIFIMAASGRGWDHVSSSLKNRCPTWYEMDFIKHLFFHPHEAVMQLHVPAADHINFMPHCLHLWRPIYKKIPLPPKDLV